MSPFSLIWERLAKRRDLILNIVEKYDSITAPVTSWNAV
jgi:hypothetical protein